VLVAGLGVADLRDLMAMKIKVMAERGEMRDYFDVKAIDERGGISVEEGVALYMRRYGAPQLGSLRLRVTIRRRHKAHKKKGGGRRKGGKH
jgi:Nucleotidyl transferase AbiEii toxin, Type IV TA system